MRVRNNVFALVTMATTASVVVLSSATPAMAQGSAPLAAPATPVAVRVGGDLQAPAILPGVEHLYTPPVVLGEAWARALRTVLDGMKHLVDTQKVAALPLRPEAPALPAPRAIRTIPAWRARWTPAGALREALAASPVQAGPVAGVPPLETGVDAHGQNVVLLGARVELPWRVP